MRIKQGADGQPHGFVSDPRTGEKRPFITAAELLGLLQERPFSPPPTHKEKNNDF
ncbi:MAG: hypothetical protein IPM39_11125 [Chloroflexi bacterium]|nr:hypothetical protein [Chloroflexota bacterium]